MLKKFIAFSLAEVLMVAGIAAVVGAMTIPNMKKSYEKKARIAKAKTTFATLDGAIAQIDYIKELRGASNKSTRMMNKINETVQFRYICGVKRQSTACFNRPKFTDSTATNSDTVPVYSLFLILNNANNCSTAILKNGAEIALCWVNTKPYNSGIFIDYHGIVVIDVDGDQKGPHTRGQDVFAFNIGSTGLSYFQNSIEANLLDH